MNPIAAQESSKPQSNPLRCFAISVAGLRYGPDHGSGRGAPLETKSGSYIYAGDAASFHDWELRTLLRINLLESQEDAARAAAIATEAPSEEAEGPGMANGEVEKEFPTTEAPAPAQSTATPTSPKSSQ